MTYLRTGPQPPRCRYGLKFGVNLLTRCKNNKLGHGGFHEGRGLKKFPYQKIRWFPGDGREFITDADHEFAWSERRKGAGREPV